MWVHDNYCPEHSFNEPNLIQITSEYEFYDMFLVIKEKFRLRIKETILMKKGGIYAWLFTSKPNKGSFVLKKKAVNTVLLEYLKNNLPIPSSKNFQSLIQLLQFVDSKPKNKSMLSFFVRTVDSESYLSTAYNLINEINKNNSDVKFIQQPLELDREGRLTKERDKYYTHVFHYIDPKTKGARHRIFTKQLVNKKKLKLNKLKTLEEIKYFRKPVIQDIIPTPFVKEKAHSKSKKDIASDGFYTGANTAKHADDKIELVFTSSPEFEVMYTPSFNALGNGKIEKLSNQIIKFLEKNMLIKVREIHIKFCYDRNGGIYFVGISKLLAVIRVDEHVDRIISKAFHHQINDDIDIPTIDITKYMKALLDIGEEEEDLMKMLRVVKPPKKLIKTKPKFICKGFFCDYEITDKVENFFKVKKEVEIDLLEAERGGVKLQDAKRSRFSVTCALLEKIENNIQIFDQILNIFNIINPKNKALISKESLSKEQRTETLELIKTLDIISEKPTSKLKHTIFKYKNVQVCKKCYNIITYVQSMIEKKLNADLNQLKKDTEAQRLASKYRILSKVSQNDFLPESAQRKKIVLKDKNNTLRLAQFELKRQGIESSYSQLTMGHKIGLRRPASMYMGTTNRSSSYLNTNNSQKSTVRANPLRPRTGIRSSSNYKIAQYNFRGRSTKPLIKNYEHSEDYLLEEVLQEAELRGEGGAHFDGNCAKEMTDIKTGNFDYYKIFEVELTENSQRRKKVELQNHLQKLDRDEEVQSYRKWIRFLKFINIYSQEPALNRLCNIYYAYHLLKKKIKNVSLGANKTRIKIENKFEEKEVEFKANFQKSTPFHYPQAKFCEVLCLSRLPFLSFISWSLTCGFCIEHAFEGIHKSIRARIMDQTKTAIIDAKTAVPFIFFSPKNLKQEEEVIIEKVPKDIIIVCLDIFGCLTQFIRFLLEADEWILNKCYFLILNIPGQPFTLYDPDRLLRIEELSNIYDSILGRLDEDGAISIIRDKFYLLGLGFGALILSNLAINFGNEVDFLRHFISYNGVFFNDDKIKEVIVNLTESVLVSNNRTHLEILKVMNQERAIRGGNPSFMSTQYSKDSRLYLLETFLDLVTSAKSYRIISCELTCVHSPTNTFSSVLQSTRFMELSSSSKKTLKKIGIPHLCLEFASAAFLDSLANILVEVVRT